jgi:hypothetical protein
VIKIVSATAATGAKMLSNGASSLCGDASASPSAIA